MYLRKIQRRNKDGAVVRYLRSPTTGARAVRPGPRCWSTSAVRTVWTSGGTSELLLARGVVVSHETIRQWCDRFGPPYTAGLRRRRPQAGDKWHLDEVFVKINGVRQYLWRAVDQDGTVLDILVQPKRDARAAKRFMAKLMKKQRRVPRAMVTDKLRSYGVAHRELMSLVEHRSHKGLNNRAENSHQPTRQRERAMKYFRSPGAAQKFLAVFSQISPHFRPRRHPMTASEYRAEMHHRFATWNEITSSSAMATAA